MVTPLATRWHKGDSNCSYPMKPSETNIEEEDFGLLGLALQSNSSNCLVPIPDNW